MSEKLVQNKNKCSYVKTLNTPTGHQCVTDIDTLTEHIQQTGVGYEHIDGTVVPYFDFDNCYKTEAEQEANEEQDYKRAVEAVEQEYLPQGGKLYVTISCGLDTRTGKYKNGYHIIVRGVGYYKSGSEFFKSMSDELKQHIDPKVYKPAGKRQLFRMPYCSKEGDERPLQYYDYQNDMLYESLEDVGLVNVGVLLVQNIEGEKLVEVADAPKLTKEQTARLARLKKRAVAAEVALQPQGCDEPVENTKTFETLTDAEYKKIVQCIGKICDNSDGTGWGVTTRLKFVFSSACIADKYGLELEAIVKKALRKYSPNLKQDEIDSLLNSYGTHDSENKTNYSCATLFELAEKGDHEKYIKLRHAIYKRNEAEAEDSSDEEGSSDDEGGDNVVNGGDVCFDVFRDYKQLLKLYKDGGGHALDGKIGMKWIKATITCIERGGRPMYMTRNKRLTKDGNTEFYYEIVPLAALRQSVKKEVKFKNLQKTEITKKGRCSTLSGLLEYAAMVDEIPNYNTVDFVPYLDNPPKLHDTFNMFGGYPLKHAINESKEEIECDAFINSGIYKHIRDEICDGDAVVFDWLMRWLGHIVQYPTKRTGFMPLIQSEQGGGKDLTGLLFAKIVGENHGLAFNQMSEFMQKHNSEQQGRLLIRLNEISDKATGKTDHNKLKGKIDEKTIRIEPKGVDAYEVSNYANYIGFSNFKDTLYIENSDRRYVCIEANNRLCNDKVYFAPLWAELENNTILMSAFHYFATLDVETFLVEGIPDTDYKRSQKTNNLSNVYRFVIDMINDKRDTVIIGATVIYNEYCTWCLNNGEKSMMKKTFATKLTDLKYTPKASRAFGKVKKCYTFGVAEFEQAMRTHLRDPTYTLLIEIDEMDEINE